MAWRVERWGDPWAGGWMAWPAGMRAKMETALNVYNLLQSAQHIPAGGVAKWATTHPAAWSSLQEILKLVDTYDDTD